VGRADKLGRGLALDALLLAHHASVTDTTCIAQGLGAYTAEDQQATQLANMSGYYCVAAARLYDHSLAAAIIELSLDHAG
jgi:hypothetical protein